MMQNLFKLAMMQNLFKLAMMQKTLPGTELYL